MKLNLSKFFQAQFNVTLFQKLPPSVCYCYMQIIGKLYYLVRRKEKLLIERNIKDLLCGQLAEEPQSCLCIKSYIRKVTRQTFKGIFAHYYEKMFSAFKDVRQIERLISTKVTIQNEKAIQDALALGRGVILVTAHWGAVEFIPWALGFKKYPISVIMECQTKILEKALYQKAGHVGAEMILCSGNISTFYNALQSLKRNRLLMTECDEVDAWRKKSNQTIELFGKKLFFDPTLNILAKRSGAPVVGVFLERVSRSSYVLTCETISSGGRYAETAYGALSLWQKYVKRHPEQWYQWKKWGAMKVAS